ncbi:uncharacterized protein ACBR49_013665 [Aulostomus maculatus]
MHCSASTTLDSISWFWERMENQTWHRVGFSRNLTVTEPQESGLYRCLAERWSSQSASPHHMVYIVSVHATVAENLGIAGLIFSLLALMINGTILLWLGFRKLPTSTSSTGAGFPPPVEAPNGDLPQHDGDVYINYTNTNQAYTDLNPVTMTGDNIYSSVS